MQNFHSQILIKRHFGLSMHFRMSCCTHTIDENMYDDNKVVTIDELIFQQTAAVLIVTFGAFLPGLSFKYSKTFLKTYSSRLCHLSLK